MYPLSHGSLENPNFGPLFLEPSAAI